MFTTSQIFTGRIPFVDSVHDSTVISRVQSGDRPSRPPGSDISWRSWGLTEAVWSLMEICWNRDPAARPTADKIINQVYHTSIADDRPAHWEGTNSPARFHNSVTKHSDVLDVSQLEALIFDFREEASGLI